MRSVKRSYFREREEEEEEEEEGRNKSRMLVQQEKEVFCNLYHSILIVSMIH